jgi:hypothetical protein
MLGAGYVHERRYTPQRVPVAAAQSVRLVEGCNLPRADRTAPTRRNPPDRSATSDKCTLFGVDEEGVDEMEEEVASKGSINREHGDIVQFDDATGGNGPMLFMHGAESGGGKNILLTCNYVALKGSKAKVANTVISVFISLKGKLIHIRSTLTTGTLTATPTKHADG